MQRVADGERPAAGRSCMLPWPVRADQDMACVGEVGLDFLPALLNLRYGFGSGPGEGIEPIMDPLTFTLDFGTEKVPLKMQMEEMDGMFAAYFASDAPIVALLKSATTVSINTGNDPKDCFQRL